MTTGLMMARQLRQQVSQPLTVRLYVGVSPDGETLIEVSGGGYRVPAALTVNDWTIQPGNPAVGEATVQEFRFDGTKRIQVLGSYLAQANGDPITTQPFPEPIVVGRRGDIIPVRPIMRMAVLPATA